MAKSSFQIAEENIRRLEREAGGVLRTGGGFGVGVNRSYSNNPLGRKKRAEQQFSEASARIPEFIRQKQQHEMDLALEAQKLQNKGSLAEAKIRGGSALDVAKLNLKFEREKLAEEKALVQNLMAGDEGLGAVGEAQKIAPGLFQTAGGKSGLIGDLGALSDSGIWQTGKGTYTNKPQTEIPQTTGEPTAALPPGFTPPRKHRARLTPYEQYVGRPVASTFGAAKGAYGGYQRYIGQPFERGMSWLNKRLFPEYIE